MDGNAVDYNSKSDNTNLNGMYDSDNDKNGIDLVFNSCGANSIANNSISSRSNGEIVNPKVSQVHSQHHNLRSVCSPL